MDIVQFRILEESTRNPHLKHDSGRWGRFIRHTYAAVFTALLLWRKKQYAAMIIFPIAIAVTNFINKWLKAVVARERPFLNEVVEELSYSFPSGHAMLSIVTYGFIVFLIVNGKFGKATRVTAVAAAIILIVTIGLSRIVLSAHYPSDVLGGYYLGGMLLVLFLYAHHFLKTLMK